MPKFQTQPIVDNKILKEIVRFNVTTLILLYRYSSYVKEDERITVMRAIRCCEYRDLQLKAFDKFGRTMSMGEHQISTLLNEPATVDAFFS